MIIWKDEIHSVHNETIDTQHKRLVEMINELDQAVTSGKEYQIVNKVLEQALEYTVYHFQTEEDLMEQASFPEREQHTAEHEAFKRKVKQLQKRETNLDILVPIELLMYLRNWLTKHIQSSDKDLGLFLLG